MKTQTVDPLTESIGIQPRAIFHIGGHKRNRGFAWLRLAAVCAMAITLAGALSAATPITYTFNGSCSGYVGDNPSVAPTNTFTNAAFTITVVVADLTTIQSGSPVFTLPVAGVGIQLAGIGSGTFTDVWQVLNDQSSGLIEFADSIHGTVLGGTNAAFTTYNMQSPIGPVPLNGPTTFDKFNSIPATFSSGNTAVTIQSVSDVTFTASEAQPGYDGCTQAIITCALSQPPPGVSQPDWRPEFVSNGQCSNLPADATDIQDGYQDSVVGGDGELSALYPGVNTSLNNWYTPAVMPCPSIGGTLPPIVQPTITGVDAAAADALAETLAATLPPPPQPPFGYFPPLANGTSMPGPYDPVQAANFSCDPSLNPTYASTESVGGEFCNALGQSPFHGKDIIYVHGLFEDVIQALALGTGKSVPPGCPATDSGFPEWPSCPSAFTTPGGYFRYQASQYWNDTSDVTQSHIQNYLINQYPSNASAGTPRNPRSLNRYITVGWSTAQSLAIAANTVLYQIADAMVNGNGVTFLPGVTDPRGKSGFCVDGCIVISHSTGGPVTDVAMSFASDTNYQSKYNTGIINFIPDNIRVHVALAGAFSGSQYATTALILAYIPRGTSPCVHSRPLRSMTEASLIFRIFA